MRPHLLILIAVIGTLVWGFSYRGAGAADDKLKPPGPGGSLFGEGGQRDGEQPH